MHPVAQHDADVLRSIHEEQRAEQLQELKDAVDEYAGRFGGLRDLYDWQWQEDPQGLRDAMPESVAEDVGAEVDEGRDYDETRRDAWNSR